MRRIFVVVMLVLLAACGSPASQQKVSPPATSPTTGASGTNPGVTTPRTTPSTPAPSALDQLSAFVADARTLDTRLHAAAQAINRAGPPWPQVSPAVAAAVTAASLDPVSAAIPAGLPKPLLQQTILVYSDLASRRMAMRFFGQAGLVDNQQWLLTGLHNGAPAAARFSSDLADLAALAASSRSVTVAAPTSIQAAERDLLVQYVELANAGCMNTGGQVFPTLPSIRRATPTSGQIGGVNFTAALSGSTWKIVLMAC
jgi:hypothetical protein